MKIVVTGGAGFIGSHLTEMLVSKGHNVAVFDDFSTGKEEFLQAVKGKIEIVRGDIKNYEQLKKTLKDAEAVFHLAALKSVPASVANPMPYFDTNITGTYNVLEASRLNGCKNVIFASSSAVYGENPKIPQKEGKEDVRISPYAISKYTGEDLLKYFSKLYGIRTVALRYFNVFGPRQDPNSEYAAVVPKFIKCILAGQNPPIYGTGEQSRDFTYVKDVVTANICALNSNKSGVFNVASGAPISVNMLASKIAAIIEKNISPVYHPRRAGDVPRSYADMQQSRTKLKLPQFTPFDEALGETISWFKQNQ